MDLPSGQRSRGVVLSSTGQEKLQSRIRQLDIERYTVQELVRRSQLVEAQGLHPATVRKILRIQGVDRDSIALVFKAVGLDLTHEDFTGARRDVILTALPDRKTNDSEIKATAVESPAPSSMPTTSSPLRQDWGEAVDVSLFFGRLEELTTLQQWILNDRCRLVTVLGVGGIGKTTLVTKLAEQLQDQFEFLIWRSLRNALPLDELLDDLLQFLSKQQLIPTSTTTAGKVTRLMEYLRQHRCLIVLDNLETLMQPDIYAGRFASDYENYGELLRRVGEVSHQSCLLVTSREKPDEIVMLAGESLPVRSLSLIGLKSGAIELLQSKGLTGSAAENQQLIDLYEGNPLVLKIVATTIQELFNGSIASFLDAGIASFNSIRSLLKQQIDRLTAIEITVMYWLAINREQVSLSDLEADLFPKLTKHHLLETVESLLHRSLIEQSLVGFTQQPVIMEYMTERFVAQFCTEIASDIHASIAAAPAHSMTLLNTHALLKAQSSDYIREAQIRLILKPAIAQLMQKFGSTAAITQRLLQRLTQCRSISLADVGYAGGNTLNLLHYLGIDLADYDFSQLPIWQADLQGVTLHRVNFAHATFVNTVFTQLFGTISTIAFNADSTLLATGDDLGEVHLWRIADGQLLLTLRGHTNQIQIVQFSPDNQTVISSSTDQTVRVWQVSTGQCLRTLQQYTSQVLAIGFYPISMSTQGAPAPQPILVSRGKQQTLSLWDMSSGQCLKTLPNIPSVEFVAVSPDGRWLATAGDETLSIWDIQTGDYVRSLQGHDDRVQSLAFSPDSQMLASGSADHTIRLWHISTGQCFAHLTGHTQAVVSVRFSSDAATLASSSIDQTIRLWNVTTGDALRVLQGHAHPVRSLDFSPDGHLLASGGDDQTIRLWNVDTGQSLKTVQGYTNPITSVHFGAGNTQLANAQLISGSHDGSIRLWDVSELTAPPQILNEHTSAVLAVDFSPHLSLLASGSADRTIKVWHPMTRQCLNTLLGHSYSVTSVCFSPVSTHSGNLLASGSADHTVRLWQIETADCLSVLQGHSQSVLAVCFSPNGQLLASGSADRTIKLWAVNTGQCLQTLQGHPYQVASVSFSPDGQRLASGGDLTVRLWDVATGRCLQILQGHIDQVTAVSISPDGQTLASASVDRTIRLWSVASGQCLKTLQGHTQSVLSVCFSPEGDWLASSSADETIRLWQIDTGQCVAQLRADRPYEGTNIQAAIGLTEAQKATLKALGAIEANASKLV